ncbi:MAG: hypothetical protein SGI72_11445 [Planctomycetota bacterium]|nr:hypothetical protein [Planctomycetota bacterium]
MSERRAWFLNLDAEHELEALKSYAPTQNLREIVARESVRLIGKLVAPDDVVLTEEDVRLETAAFSAAKGLVGVAWSPTRRALELLAAAGTRAETAPSMEVLRAVNARPFAARLREPFAESSFVKHVVTTLDETLAVLARTATDGWLVRRTFGAAGRGRRRISAGKPRPEELAWIAASLKFGPLVVEPWVQILCEYTRSGWVGADGSIAISRPCFQQTNEHGTWTRTDAVAAHEVSREDDDRLSATMQHVGEALFVAGYFGPFGIDAYRHRAVDGSHATALNPLSEINARFTMDWATAFAADPRQGDAHMLATGFSNRDMTSARSGAT